MDTLRMTNYIIAVVFFVCYTYQFLYIPVPWLLAKRKAAKAAALEATPHNYAVLICARNESAVIADLIGSLRSQTYDQSLLHIFVLADNCTDNTADIARSAGATVYERFNNVQVGKGYALQAGRYVVAAGRRKGGRSMKQKTLSFRDQVFLACFLVTLVPLLLTSVAGL